MMKNMNLRAKIILPTGLLIVALLLVMIIVTMTRFNVFNDYMVDERLQIAAYSARNISEDLRRMTIDFGLNVAQDPRMAAAYLTGDREEIARVANQMVAIHGITYITAFDTEGIVWVRTHEPNNHSDMIRTPSLLEALNGTISVAYSAQPLHRMPFRAAVPIFYNGEIIGGAVVALALDTQPFTEYFAQRWGTELVIFEEGISLSSTFMEADGNPVTGTQMLDVAFDTVVNQNREFLATVTLRGELYSAFFMPITDPYGNVLGQMFMALPLAAIHAERNEMIVLVAIIGIAGVVVALAILALISTRLVKPIKDVQDIIRSVAGGNLTINTKDDLNTDEVGMMMRDVYGLVDVIRNMVDDLSNVHTQYIKVGDLKHKINENKYQNSFKGMVESVNNVLEAVSADIADMVEAVDEISSGNFDRRLDVTVWVGDWAFVPVGVNNLAIGLQSVGAELNTMIDSIVDKGDLSFKIDEAKYKGDWGKIIIGLNNISEAVEKPLNVLALSMAEMSAGNLDLVDIDKKLSAAGLDPNAENYSGVFKNTIHAIDTTLISISDYIADITADLKSIADGDLTSEITRDFAGSFAPIKESLNNISSTLNKTMSEISVASEQVLSGAKQISTSAQELANGAQEQASSVEELNATVDVVNQQTRKNAESATSASELSNNTASNAQQGNKSMKEMLEAMSQIKESSSEISKVIKAIEDIAFQTNLLALNASVEAARAGEHGKGFAVVADEVRTLAGRSQTSATETNDLIVTSINRVDSGSEIAQDTAASLDTIVVNVNEVSAIIKNIATASQEQSEAILQISQGLEQISKVTQSNSAVSEETAAASQELNSQAEMLQQLVSFFKL